RNATRTSKTARGTARRSSAEDTLVDASLRRSVVPGCTTGKTPVLDARPSLRNARGGKAHLREGRCAISVGASGSKSARPAWATELLRREVKRSRVRTERGA